mmetsp:Transcript_9207/g.20024  ORF Transcript_9207/g.20024 Transcript_9207/m.20024 type:complete len:219 (-) Transcript_9207:433-1089(-)
MLALVAFAATSYVGPAAFAASKMGRSQVAMQHGGKGFGGGEATRDPEPTVIDPNDPKGKQQAIHKAESFADYLARRSGGAPAPAPAPAAPAPVAAAPAPAPVAASAPVAVNLANRANEIWGYDAKKAMYDLWNPEAPRTYENFNPFERNDEGAMADFNGCFPGQSRGYKSPLRPDQSWAIMQEEAAKMEILKQDPKFSITGRPGNFKRSWQDNLGAPP